MNETQHAAPGVLALGAFAAVLGLDVAAKEWAATSLTEPVRIADWLYLMLRHNSGMFFGTVPVSASYWVGVCAALGWFGWRALRATRAAPAVCLAVALAGLAGNAIGQKRGAVVDFIGIGPVTGDVWLVVNVADIALAGGVLVLGIYLLRERVRRAHQPRQGRPGDLHARHLKSQGEPTRPGRRNAFDNDICKR